MALYVAISPIALTAQRRQYCCGPDRGLRRRGPVRLDSERRVHQHLRLQLGRLALADARPHRRRAHIDPSQRLRLRQRLRSALDQQSHRHGLQARSRLRCGRSRRDPAPLRLKGHLANVAHYTRLDCSTHSLAYHHHVRSARTRWAGSMTRRRSREAVSSYARSAAAAPLGRLPLLTDG